jgi:uncharacterized protein
MRYNLTEVLTSGKEEKIIKTLPIKVITFGNSNYKISDGITINISLSKISDKEVLLEGNIAGMLLLSCDRCNEPVNFNYDTNFSKEIKLDDVDNIQEDYIDGYNLDLEKFILNEIYINFPMKVLCNEDCKGICKKCGTNLNIQSCKCEDDNIDPRLAGLKDLFIDQF